MAFTTAIELPFSTQELPTLDNREICLFNSKKPLHIKMPEANCKSGKYIWAILCISIILLNGCKFSELNQPKPDNTNINEDKAKTDKPATSRDKALIEKSKAKDAPPSEKGSGYLSQGSSIKMGVIDGDEEVNVLEKIRRLETRLEAERNKVKAFEEKLSELQTAKKGVEKDFADTKKRMENENKDLSDRIKALESKLSDTESRTVAAEKELNLVKGELLKVQLSEIKMQQELYKLKIDNLKQEEEEE